MEGLHALKHALRFDAAVISAFSADLDKLSKLARDLAPDVADQMAELIEVVPADLFSAMAPKAPKTGVLALAHRPSADLEKVLSSNCQTPIILLEAPAHLGNVGAVVRVASAAGAGAVITTGHHDPWNPAALRGSAGLHFAQPVLRIDEVPGTDRPLLAIHPEGDPMDPATLPANAVLAFGSERQGLSAALLERADRRLAIPMTAKVSSLNLATAVAVTLYAWRLNRPNA